MVVQQEATDEMVILAVDLLFGVKGPEGRSHQGSLLERVDCIHRRAVAQVQSHQLWDTESGCCVQRCVLIFVVAWHIDICTFMGKRQWLFFLFWMFLYCLYLRFHASTNTSSYPRIIPC